MALYFVHFAITVLFLLLLYLLQAYKNFKKKTAGFPFYNIFVYLLHSYITGKIKKDTSFSTIALESLVEEGKRFWKEGLFMTYFSRPVLFIYGEEVIKAFSNEKAALDKSPEYKFFSDVIKPGLLTSNGERWKTHRKLINPAFQLSMLKEKVPHFNLHAVNLVTEMKELIGEPSVDIFDLLKFHYFSALSESVFGLKQDKENRAKLHELASYVDNICAMTIRRMIFPWLRPKLVLKMLSSGKEFYKERKHCHDFTEKIILDMKKHVYNNADVEYFGSHLRKSFTYILLNQHRKDPTFTFEDVHSEVTTILSTGYDTVAISTLWCLYLLGLHPEIQEKLYDEIQLITSDYITYEEVFNLAYLEAVIMESLRIYPTVPLFMRNLTEDVQYGKYKVSKGTTIAFFPYLSHRNPEIYPDPEEFKPERFLHTETKKASSFMPFSEGSRSCIGKTYALIEMKIFLSHVIRNFKITSLDRQEDIKFCWKLSIIPMNRLRFKIEPR